MPGESSSPEAPKGLERGVLVSRRPEEAIRKHAPIAFVYQSISSSSIRSHSCRSTSSFNPKFRPTPLASAAANSSSHTVPVP